MDHMTAKVSCFARAYHYKNNTAHIFTDNMAARLLGEDYSKIAESMKKGIPFFLPEFKGTPEQGLRIIADKQLSPSVLGRSAYCEKMLANEMRFGCSQYVIFASGYDTYSLRHAEGPVSVFELDLPEVMEDKAERIAKAGLEENAVMVPCDLAKDEWVKKLLSSGYVIDKKSFGSLLGISYYLKKAEWESLLKQVAEIMPCDSAICFDYPDNDESHEAKVNKALANSAGEQMKALYTYEEMEKLLSGCGFKIYEHLNAKEITEQYFNEYNKLNPEHLMSAPEGVAYILAVRG